MRLSFRVALTPEESVVVRKNPAMLVKLELITTEIVEMIRARCPAVRGKTVSGVVVAEIAEAGDVLLEV